MGKPQREVDPFREELRTLRQALGGRIRELRSVRGWSQEEFADMAHIHRTFAGSLERGEKNVNFHALVLIARSFGLTVAELLSGVEAGESTPALRSRAIASNLDRSRVLSEAEGLERTARYLREIARVGITTTQRPKSKP